MARRGKRRLQIDRSLFERCSGGDGGGGRNNRRHNEQQRCNVRERSGLLVNNRRRRLVCAPLEFYSSRHVYARAGRLSSAPISGNQRAHVNDRQRADLTTATTVEGNLLDLMAAAPASAKASQNEDAARARQGVRRRRRRAHIFVCARAKPPAPLARLLACLS